MSSRPDTDAIVRPARQGDAPGIGTVHVESWRAAYAGLVPAAVLDGLSVERRTGYWQHAIDAPDEGALWVVERDGEVVGFAASGPARDDDLPPGCGEVHAIYVRSDAWGRGLGKALFDQSVAALRDRGRWPLVLWVLTDNRRGRDFYERQGWQADGSSRILDFDGTPIEELRYRSAPGGGTMSAAGSRA